MSWTAVYLLPFIKNQNLKNIYLSLYYMYFYRERDIFYGPPDEKKIYIFYPEFHRLYTNFSLSSSTLH